MHLDDLEHSQIILLSILLTVIISVATSVSVLEKNYINQSGDLDIKFKENTYTFSEIKDSRFQNYSLYRLGELNSKLPIKSIIKIGKEVDIKIAKKVFLLNSGNKNLFYTEGVISTINKNKNKNKILNFTVSADKGNNYKNLFVFDTEGYLLGIWFKNDSKDITPIYDIISLYNSNK